MFDMYPYEQAMWASAFGATFASLRASGFPVDEAYSRAMHIGLDAVDECRRRLGTKQPVLRAGY